MARPLARLRSAVRSVGPCQYDDRKSACNVCVARSRLPWLWTILTHCFLSFLMLETPFEQSARIAPLPSLPRHSQLARRSMNMPGADETTAETDKRNRGNYRCSRCGEPKKGPRVPVPARQLQVHHVRQPQEGVHMRRATHAHDRRAVRARRRHDDSRLGLKPAGRRLPASSSSYAYRVSHRASLTLRPTATWTCSKKEYDNALY